MTDKIKVQVDQELADLVPNFLTNRRNDIARLREAFQAGDFDSMRHIGHNMKGVGGGYGFAFITELGGKMESAALARDLASIEQCIESYTDYMQRLDVEFV